MPAPELHNGKYFPYCKIKQVVVLQFTKGRRFRAAPSSIGKFIPVLCSVGGQLVIHHIWSM